MGGPSAPVWELGSWGRLAVDDTVEVAGRRLRVCGWIAYGDDEDSWVDYLLDDGRWLCVEDEGGLRFSVWEDQDVERHHSLGDADFLYGGVRYRRVERYRCRWQAAGVEGLTGPGMVQVADYAAEDGERLAALEDWGEGPELTLGRWLHPRDVGR